MPTSRPFALPISASAAATCRHYEVVNLGANRVNVVYDIQKAAARGGSPPPHRGPLFRGQYRLFERASARSDHDKSGPTSCRG